MCKRKTASIDVLESDLFSLYIKENNTRRRGLRHGYEQESENKQPSQLE